MAKLEFIKESETNTIVGKSLEIGERVLYPIIQISILKDEKIGLKGAWISPIAIVVEENTEKYVIPFTGEDIDLEEFFRLVDHHKSQIKNR